MTRGESADQLDMIATHLVRMADAIRELRRPPVDEDELRLLDVALAAPDRALGELSGADVAGALRIILRA